MQHILEQLIQTSVHGNQDSDAHLMSLFGIALSLRPKLMLELGVRSGTTTLPLLLAAKFTGSKLYSVDISPTSFIPPLELKPFWEFIEDDAMTALGNAADNDMTFDLVFIDDWHSYKHVKRELEYVKDVVTPKSLIILHDLMYDWKEPDYHSEIDTNNPEWADGGPYRAVNELDKDKWEFSTVPRSNGLTILRKKF